MFLTSFLAFAYDHFCIMFMSNIPTYAVYLFLIKVWTLKVDICVERCIGKFDDSESYFVW